MRKPLLSAVLTLFLLLSASITWAQKVSVSGNVYEKGTVKNSFKTPHGTITTTLPDDIRPGDVISGTVSYEPEGRKEKDKDKNRAELFKYNLSLEPNRGTGPASAEALKDVFVLQNKPQASMHGGAEHAQDVFVTEFTVPAEFAGNNNLYLRLRDGQKNIVAESTIPILSFTLPALTLKDPTQIQQSSRIFIPDKKIYMEGELALIYYSPVEAKHKSGSLVYLNRTRQKELSAQQLELKPLVSSPRKMIVEIPNNIYGPAELVFQDQNKKIIASEKIHVLKLEASCPKTNLKRGESTLLTVKVKGLEGCPADYLRLSLNNTTSGSVLMGRSNHEELFIEPVSLKYSVVNFDYAAQKKTEAADEKKKNWEKSSEKEFSLQRSVTGLQTGNFNIDITLNYPASVYNDPFRQQLDALKTAEQFDRWKKAFQHDLANVSNISNSGIGKPIIDQVIHFEFDKAKSLVYNYARWLDVPPGMGRLSIPYLNSTLEAGKAAVTNAINEKGTAPVHYEVIESALQSARQQAQSSGDKQLMNNADSLRKRLLNPQREMHNFSDRTQILEDILKTFNETSKSITNNMRASVDKLNTIREFKNALITEISFPKMDAADKKPPPIIVIFNPNEYSVDKRIPPSKEWSPNNFRFEMDGLPCKKINKIDGFTIKQGVKPVSQLAPQNPIRITISEEDLKAWQDWYRNSMEKNGSIEYFDETNRSLISLDLLKVKPVNITPAANGSFNFIIQPADIKFSYNPQVLFNLHSSHYVANEIAGQPCNPEGASTYTWLYIEKPCRIEIATTRASNIDPDDEDALSKIEDLFGEVSEDGADLGKKLSKAFSITKSFAVWVRVVRDWESYKAEYVCRNGAWQHGEMTLVNSGQKVLYGWELFRGESGNDTWHGGDDMSWIMKQAEDIKNKVCE